MTEIGLDVGAMEVDHIGNKATWELTQEEIAGCKSKGEYITSKEAIVGGHIFRMICYPKGHQKCGKSGVGLEVQTPGQFSFRLGMSTSAKVIAEDAFECNFTSGEVHGFTWEAALPSSDSFTVYAQVLGSAESERARWGTALEKEKGAAKAALDKESAAKAALEKEKSVAKALREEKHELERRAAGLEELLGLSAAQGAERQLLRRCRAAQIQRAWCAAAARTRAQREWAEAARRAQHARLSSRIAAFQVLWRLRQERLHQRRADVDAARMAERRPSTHYDAMLAFQSLSRFISTGQVELLRAAKTHFDVVRMARYRIVAVVGLFDTGKTFLINKLFGVRLPVGKLHTTQGLSFLWLEERRMLVLDSAGVQATVSYRAQAVQPILDAETTESLVFELISRIAHHTIFVVNDLTRFEQKYIAMLHQKRTRQTKELIVVHNLRSTGIVEEARGLFSRQITQCYDGERSHLGELVFTADHGESAPQVHHIGLCNEASAAGERFNDKNCQLLLEMLELRNMLGSNLQLADLLRQEIEQLLPKFVNLEPAERVLEAPEAPGTSENGTQGLESRVDVKFESSPALAEEGADGYLVVGRLTMHASRPGHRVAMKTRGVISPLGEIIAHDVSFEPIVNIFDRAGEFEVRRFITVECPGVADDDVELEELPNGVKVTIQKRKAIDEMAVRPILPIRQHHGMWQREFHFEASDGRLELCGPEEFGLEGGVLTVVLKRNLQPRKVKFGARGAAAAAQCGHAAAGLPASAAGGASQGYPSSAGGSFTLAGCGSG